MTKINIIDACCGSGKTTQIIERIAKLPESQKVIVVVPLLSETHRIAGTYPKDGVDMAVPEASHSIFGNYIYDTKHPLYLKFFKHPTNNNEEGSKLVGLESLLKQGENIVTTHSLFRSLTPECLGLVRSKGYLLIIDEALSVYTEYNDLDRDSVLSLIEDNFVALDEDGITLRWVDSKSRLLPRYEKEVYYCDNGSLLLVDGKCLLWELPIDVIRSFKEIWMATYMFEGSYMCGYLKYHNLPYNTEHFGKGGKDFKKLINIIDDPKLNAIGEKVTALSYTSQCSVKTYNVQLRKNLINFFRHKTEALVNERLWCCFKGAFNTLKGTGYTKSFLSVGTKATNDYRHTLAVAYTVNLFNNPFITKLLSKRNVVVDEDLYALSEMIQWLYRSRIRDGKSITAYIPSRRMRSLLTRWLEGEFDIR